MSSIELNRNRVTGLRTDHTCHHPHRASELAVKSGMGIPGGHVTVFDFHLQRLLCAGVKPKGNDQADRLVGKLTIKWLTSCMLSADDINGIAGEEEELAKLVERLDKASTAYSMEISADKTKLMTNNTSDISTEININGQKLETVTSFKYLGSFITDEGSKPEIISRIAPTTAALTRLKLVWNDRSISLSSKIRLMRSLVISIFLCTCESWTLTA